MAYACIDIGSNTTRLLVAEAADGQLRELLQQRAFTRIGKGRKRDDRIDEEKIAEVAGGVPTQRRLRGGAGTPRPPARPAAARPPPGNGRQPGPAARAAP